MRWCCGQLGSIWGRWPVRTLRSVCVSGRGGGGAVWELHHQHPPTDGTITVVLPEPLRRQHANAPRGRYVLDAAAVFNHRGEQWADRVGVGAPVRYDITYDPVRRRWYLDASWSTVKKGRQVPVPTLDVLRAHPVLAVDVNADHLAAWILDPCGNPVGAPRTLPLELAGLPATTRGCPAEPSAAR